MSAINFLRERRRHLTKTQQTDRLILRWVIRGLLVVLVIAVGILVANFIFDQRLKNLGQAQDSARQNILANQEVEKDFVLGVQKLKILTKLFETRADKQEAIDYFSTVFGASVLVKQVEYNGDEKLLTFRLEALDVFVLEQVFKRIQSPEIKEKFKKATPSDLRRTSEGTYQMTVAVVL